MFTVKGDFKMASGGLRKNNHNRKREDSDLEKFSNRWELENPKLFVKGNLIKLAENCVLNMKMYTRNVYFVIQYFQ